MGSQQRQHLVSLGSLPSLCAQIAEAVSYQSNADYILSDLQAPLSLLAMLFRRCEPNTLPARHYCRNSYACASLHKC